VLAAIEGLTADHRLARCGRKYPTVWLANRPVRPRTPRAGRAASGPARRPRGSVSDLARELERYRRRVTRDLRWKAYMVFQRRAIAAIDLHRPASTDPLARIPGLGSAKIARFGGDILAVVQRHTRHEDDRDSSDSIVRAGAASSRHRRSRSSTNRLPLGTLVRHSVGQEQFHQRLIGHVALVREHLDRLEQ